MVMTKSGLVLGATAVALTAVTVTGAGLHLSQSQAFFKESPKELVDEVWQIIDRNYVDATFNQVDWRAVRQEYLNRPYGNREEAYEAIREMLEQLEDPYTRFMDPKEFENMQIDTSGELTGVGIQLAQEEETNELVVIAPIEDTPAFRAGVQARDVIKAIDGKSTEGMDINQAVNLIRGPVGSEVVLTIEREEETMNFTIRRDRIEIHPVRYSYKDSPYGGVGYIRLTQFNANAVAEMRDAIEDLEGQNVVGYILDLRSNPGGLLNASIEIARMWLDRGTIVSTVNRQGEIDRESANGRAIADKPLVVLVDGGSASASEILSGALQDNGRGTIVGTQTFGKGLVQSVRGLGDGSGLAVTIAKYLTPSGRDINHEGIVPDIEVDLSEEERKAIRQNRTLIGTLGGDPQYSRALSILGDKVAEAKATTPAPNVLSK
ncbi:carboxyl-terminal processing protease CtpC [Oxynema aestuarii]|jgi:carboxyl-terminal processing protease|uniref:Carboxyl-terminal-processing protease n=1 Tax=Oxynema aestuarii AP17 TaxID=2064643 RepID=A0A6H1TWB4_9CYAN|nr:carboxyl-terminal processing protease CtpC [Oxynema aestuarii]QIZ70735.1 PDZ domain-containing protein [Oxynema aestuarii AP17]RMH71598.1 MAG: PDZ domain-containing protein [Cyanobacteria bacterium J007]